MRSETIDAICKKAGRLSATRITVILPDGTVIGDSRETPQLMDNHANRPEIITALAGQTGKSLRFSNTLMQDMLYVAVPIRDRQGIVAAIRTSLPATAVETEIRSIQLKIALSGCIIALLAAGISWVIYRRISRPIEQMKKSAAQFAGGDLSHRLTSPATEEMTSLADAMNQMAAQLDNRIETIISQRNQLETVLASMLEGVIAIDSEERIVSINRAAAQLFENEPANCQDKSIQEVIRSPALQQFIRSALNDTNPAEEKKIRIDLDCEKDTTAIFDPTLIEQAVVNLLDNALKYSEPQGKVLVKSHQQNSEIIISVQDHGIGIAQKHLSRLFERFYRVDKARSRNLSGTGLGLAIVKHIAQAHGGHVTVESKLGEGSRFSIYLPQNK